MARMRGGVSGRNRMREVTASVLRRVQAAAPTMTEKELEARMPMGLRSLKLDIARGIKPDLSAGDGSSGQAFKRYLSKETSFSLAKLAAVVDAASTSIGLKLSDGDLFRLGLHELPEGSDPTSRLDRFEKAERIFAVGIERMHQGLMPLSPSRQGGRPRAARDAVEASAAFEAWKLELASLGARVREERPAGPPDLLEPEDEDEQRHWDYGSLEPWQRPFSPVDPHPATINRLKLKLSGNWGADMAIHPQPLDEPQRATASTKDTSDAKELTSRDDPEVVLRKLLNPGGEGPRGRE